MFKEISKKITSLQHPLIKHLTKVRQNQRYRELHRSVLIPGYKLVREIASRCKPKSLFIVEDTPIDDLPEAEATFLVTEPIIKKITGLPSPEGIAAEFLYPEPIELDSHFPILALDHISDPGNLGTLIRTALALGWKGVFFLPNCVDPFHEKVIRASRGALFRLSWQKGDWEDLKKLAKKNQLTPLIADIEGHSIHTFPHPEKVLLILSNEAKGVSNQGAAWGEKITIPMKGEMESLNVAIAGAILMDQLNL